MLSWAGSEGLQESPCRAHPGLRCRCWAERSSGAHEMPGFKLGCSLGWILRDAQHPPGPQGELRVLDSS